MDRSIHPFDSDTYLSLLKRINENAVSEKSLEEIDADQEKHEGTTQLYLMRWWLLLYVPIMLFSMFYLWWYMPVWIVKVAHIFYHLIFEEEARIPVLGMKIIWIVWNLFWSVLWLGGAALIFFYKNWWISLRCWFKYVRVYRNTLKAVENWKKRERKRKEKEKPLPPLIVEDALKALVEGVSTPDPVPVKKWYKPKTWLNWRMKV